MSCLNLFLIMQSTTTTKAYTQMLEACNSAIKIDMKHEI